MQGECVTTANLVQGLAIGALAQRTGCSVATIRYYEGIKLIPSATRRASGHRVYGQQSVDLLVFIRRCRDFGFPIEQIRDLVALSQSNTRACTETLDITQAHLLAVRSKLADLRELELSLTRFAAACSERCAGGPAADCCIQVGISAASKKGCCA